LVSKHRDRSYRRQVAELGEGEEPEASGHDAGHGAVSMTTTLAKLLQQKQQLVERLQEEPGPEEREQIEQLLAKINRALDLLDGAGQVVATNRWRVSMSDPKLKISEAIRRFQIAVRMSEYRRFMERFSNQGDHTAIERADQVMRIVNRHRNEIAELKKKLDEPE
jgi:hypothetical protein